MLALIIVTLFTGAKFDSDYHFSHYTALPGPIFYLIVSACQLILSILQERYLERIERRRFAAVQGNQLFLAADLPAPVTASLPLPITIKLRPKKGCFLLIIECIVGELLIAMILFAGLLTWFLSFPFLPVSDQQLINFLVFCSIIFGPALVILFPMLILPPGRQQIKVTEGGLAVRNGGIQTSRVLWHDACLFAMYGTFGAQKNRAAITYELSSARDIVRWTWVLRKTYWVGLGPTIPHDEYNRQMQALLAFVTARTGLPLYDLREDLPNGGRRIEGERVL